MLYGLYITKLSSIKQLWSQTFTLSTDFNMMNLGVVISYGFLLLCLLRQISSELTYDIPVTFNALIQDSINIGPHVKLFYEMDPVFYSNVTVIDAAKNSEERIQETIKKSISVVFLTVASSYVSKILTLSDLQYKTRSKWSYTVNVSKILEASQGALSEEINDTTVIFQIQENAMKVLEKRFQFQRSEILNRLKLKPIDYYAVNEATWINVVGIIVEKVSSSKSEHLNLTTCYLAELVNKTVAQMQGFTLNEVDKYIYNTTVLLGKLPQYTKNAKERLYQTFHLTSTDFATISDRSLSEIDSLIFYDFLKLFINSALRKLRVTVDEITEKDPSFDKEMLLPCSNKWEAFSAISISQSFENSAEAMAIEVKTLSALIGVHERPIKQLTIIEMINLLETTIDPLSADKKLVETSLLSSVIQLNGSEKIDRQKDGVFQIIYRLTNLTERQLAILYGWDSGDFAFSSMFTIDETSDVCTIDSLNYDLLALAKVTVGHVGDIPCKAFNALREIWDRKSVNMLENKYSPGKPLPLNAPISMMVSQLTQAPPRVNFRVLNTTFESAKFISSLSINNITEVTTYQTSYLKTMSFQDIVGIIVHLKRNGSFDHELVSHFVLTSLPPSL